MLVHPDRRVRPRSGRSPGSCSRSPWSRARSPCSTPLPAARSSIPPQGELRSEEQRDSVARMSARVAPFVQQVAEAGVITPENRALAAQLARRLRRELVNATSRSWLDVVAHETGMIVSDPARLADSMNESQRAALRGLLVAATGQHRRRPSHAAHRAACAGRTARRPWRCSIDVDLPEGRRLLLLAPYYLTLKTTVEDLSWDDGSSLMLQFRIPPGAERARTGYLPEWPAEPSCCVASTTRAAMAVSASLPQARGS